MKSGVFRKLGSAVSYKPVLLSASIAGVVALAVLLSASAMGEVLQQSLAFEVQELDLDSGIVNEAIDMSASTTADIKIAYNADRDLHSVVVPVTEHVEMAFVEGVAFDGITLDEVANLAFSSEAVDLPFSANDCVVVRSDQGALYKIGNAVESDTSVTFNYATW